MAGKANRRGFGYLRKLPSKRWQASYYGPDKGTHRAPRTFDYKGDAEGWLAAERALIQAGTWTPPRFRLGDRGDTVSFEAYSRTLAERDQLPELQQGEGLWRVGGRAFVVRHLGTDGERDVFDTSQRMTSAIN